MNLKEFICFAFVRPNQSLAVQKNGYYLKKYKFILVLKYIISFPFLNVIICCFYIKKIYTPIYFFEKFQSYIFAEIEKNLQ